MFVAYQVGDEVYGQTALVQRGRDGSHAEYAVVYDTVRGSDASEHLEGASREGSHPLHHTPHGDRHREASEDRCKSMWIQCIYTHYIN